MEPNPAAVPSTTAPNNEQPQQQQQQQVRTPPRHVGGGRGQRGHGRGRTPVGGRSLLSPDGTGGRTTTSTQTGQQQQQQPTTHQHRPPPALMVHASSGVPFGHVPAYLPGSSSLVEELDRRILIVLRDGKHLIGTLSSFDQFSNLVLIETVERRIVSVKDGGIMKAYYSDVPLGVYVVRGDSMVLTGEVNERTPYMEQVSLDELEKLQSNSEEPLEWDFDNDLIA